MSSDFGKRATKHAIQRSWTGIPAYLVSWCLTIFPTGFYQRQPILSWSFFWIFMALAILRFIFFGLYDGLFKEPRRKYKLLVVSVVVQAALWGGLFAWTLLECDEETMKMLMCLITAGLCAGGSVTYTPLRPIAQAYISLMLLPTVALAPFFHLDHALAITSVILFYYGHLTFIIYNASREYWKSLENEKILEEKTEELQKLSATDSLTGLFNRRHFDFMMESTWRHAFRDRILFSLVVLDIDHFKKINDAFGHLAGDVYLEAVAAELKVAFRRNDDVVARLGGEEFGVIVQGLPLEKTLEMTEAFRLKIEKLQVCYDGKKLHGTISAGVAHGIPADLDGVKTFFTEADGALYKAKFNGRNRVEGPALEPVSGTAPHSRLALAGKAGCS